MRDAATAAKAANPNFNWAAYDHDGDGIIDHLWVVFAGMGEEQSAGILNALSYGEGTLLSQSGNIDPAYEVAPGVKVGPYLVVPENAALGVSAHEYGHNLGAIDLYATGGAGQSSAGFWTLMADNWVGYPKLAEPPVFDPMHLDQWGWLHPKVISNPYQEYSVNLGQASRTPSGAYRGVQIQLPDERGELAVKPNGTLQWWGGAKDSTDSMMTLKSPIMVPGSGSTALSFSTAYQTEESYDFLWVQASSDSGAHWTTLTNAQTTCQHAPDWAGAGRGFPNDLCAAGIGGLNGRSAGYPNRITENFSLSAFAGKPVLLRFWYMTDLATLGDGVFVDDVRVSAGDQTAFLDDADGVAPNWTYAGEWQVTDGYTPPFSHSYYLQWRNVAATGGFDKGLGDPLWVYGPGNTGLLVWYNNNRYSDDNPAAHLFDWPSFGPKGVMLPVDSHPEPYRDPSLMAKGFNNEGANIGSQYLMLDAPFGLHDTASFLRYGVSGQGRPAVKQFSDALGFYPGAELTRPSPADSSQKWITKQWDAGVVVPSRLAYGLRAPGYKAGQELLFQCVANVANSSLDCASRSSNLGNALDGGNGNPSDVGGQYGWNVEVLSQTDSQATLRIWNDFNTPLVNAASYANGPVAPGSLVTIFGANGATGSEGAPPGQPLPTKLAGVTVLINDVPAPLMAVLPGQVNAQVPYGTRPGIANLKVGPLTGQFQIVDAAPGIFSIGDRAIAISPAWTLIGMPESPAPAGSGIMLYVTGQGILDHAIDSGAMAPASPLMRPLTSVAVTIGGKRAPVSFAGLAPGFVGLMQVNLQVPSDLMPGDYPILVMQGRAISKPAMLAVRAPLTLLRCRGGR